MTNTEQLEAIKAKLVELKDLISNSLSLRAVGGSHVANELLAILPQLKAVTTEVGTLETQIADLEAQVAALQV